MTINVAEGYNLHPLTDIKADVWIIRGLPGTGKTEVAEWLKERRLIDTHIEATQFFINADGEYHFIPERVRHSHLWCINRFETEVPYCNIALTNTNSRVVELRPYLRNVPRKLRIAIVELPHNADCTIDSQTADRMRARWESLAVMVDAVKRMDFGSVIGVEVTYA